jgi:thymidylate kinase
MVNKRGLFTMIEGLDASGKGVIQDALFHYLLDKCAHIFNVDNYGGWARPADPNGDVIEGRKAELFRTRLPEFKEFTHPHEDFQTRVIFTSEPSYTWIGAAIRDEIVQKNGRLYTAEEEIQSFSLDRLIQMQRVVVPALESGIDVIQSRGLPSTLCYQSLRAEDEGRDVSEVRERILSHSGNQYQLYNAPDLLLIATVSDIDEIMRRMEARKVQGKDDKSQFDDYAFQSRLHLLYSDPLIKELFESYGSRVEYINADISIDETRRQAIDLYEAFLYEQNP